LRTLGIDLASKPKRSAACLITWEPDKAAVEHLRAEIDDSELNRLAATAAKVGIDIPFGWPDQFVLAVSAHNAHEPWPEPTLEAFRYRRTDIFIWNATKLPPLSVSTDRLGIPAFRIAKLLSDWDADRTGGGKFVEVYPRAARNQWKLGKVRTLSEVIERAPWLSLSPTDATRCDENEDCFDALVAALVARAQAIGECEPIPEDELAMAGREGWIALPRDSSLERLINTGR
jgi:predicted nuclease with RNAse H fold